jgi:hypothetical protein
MLVVIISSVFSKSASMMRRVFLLMSSFRLHIVVLNSFSTVSLSFSLAQGGEGRGGEV